MKIGGVELKGPNMEVIVFPRPDGNIVIKAQTVKNFKEFEALVKVPEPGGVRTKQGFQKDYKAQSYLDALALYEKQRFAYMCIKSLEPSEIEWEKTDISNPSTYLGWEDELNDAGLSEIEINKITLAITIANSVDERKMQAARDAFLLGLEEEESNTSGPQTELQST